MARRRLLRLALLPILAPIFLIGWMLTFAGQSKTSKKQMPKNRLRSAQKGDGVKMGMLDELKEEITHSH